MRRLIPTMLLAALGFTLAVALSILAGCEDAAVELEMGVCSVASDCPDAQTCTFGFCVTDEMNTLELRARIIPPPGTGLLQQQVPAVPLAAGPDVLVTLVQPVTLYGVVRHEGDALSVNVPGEIEARTPGDLPGMDYRFTSKSIEGLDADAHGYELALLPGRPYEITFRAESKTLPPHVFSLPPESVVDGQFDIALPAKTDYVPVEGIVRFDTYSIIAGARVTALLPDGTGVPAVTTEEKAGKFEMKLPPGTESVQLLVQAPEAGPIFPDTLTDWVEPGLDMMITIAQLPKGLGEFDVELLVVGPDDQGDLQPVAGLSVVILGDFDGGSLRRTGTTDEDGIARIRTLPGAYDVLVAVPPAHPYGTWHTKMNLTQPDADVKTTDEMVASTITLSPRPYLTGNVVGSEGEPVFAGSVIATRRPSGFGDGLAIAPAPFKAALDPNGRFVVRVDTGTYDIRVVPQASTGAPAHLLCGQDVHGDLDLDITLPAPALARVTVAAPDGSFLSDVMVELYLPSEGIEGAEGAQTMLAKGTSGPGGFVDLLVPHHP